ncbi:MAG: cyclase [Actinomycetales bacterium]|nr:MAG: cyclase [Actinomycetales bacterium]
MSSLTQASILIDADPGMVLDIIADFEAYPEWASDVKRVEVLCEEGDGWEDRVEYTLDAGVIRDTYVLEYEWNMADDGTGVVSWQLVDARVLRTMNGSYTIARHRRGGTKVTYRLAVDLYPPLLGVLKRLAEEQIVNSALRELKVRAEA